MSYQNWDLGELETMWSQRRERVQAVKRRSDSTGMTRSERDSYEREWLEANARTTTGPFQEATGDRAITA